MGNKADVVASVVDIAAVNGIVLDVDKATDVVSLDDNKVVFGAAEVL